jgi:hypothetical protein
LKDLGWSAGAEPRIAGRKFSCPRRNWQYVVNRDTAFLVGAELFNVQSEAVLAFRSVPFSRLDLQQN